ncbi:MAG TPA: M6 family metalloprotease domain-containing protein [Gemmatimonadales bacterium]|nr:M6 family metalloprotease domain-containing protein [Gemmatimonadales bacterium]
MQFKSAIPSLLGTAALVLAVAQPTEAQVARPRPGQFEVRGLDFRPNGAWRQRTNAIRAQRQAMLASGQFARLNVSGPGASATVVTGNFKIPVVPIYFNDSVPTLFPVADYQDLFFSPAPVGRPYSVKTYYEQLSNNNITMDGTVFPWVKADSAAAYYEDGCNGIGASGACLHPNSNGVSVRFAEMLLKAVAKVSTGADSLTVWAQYDNDGPDGLPNSGDDDGRVDFVTFLQPEIDGACGTNHIWAHRWYLEGLNGGSPYVTKTNRAGGGKIVISDYTIQSGQGGNGACTPGQIMPIGTVAHETGHAFGLPDLYDTQQITQGIGEFGLMGSGNYARSYSPSRMEGWSMLELGWVKVDTLDVTGTLTMNPVATSDTVWVLPTQTNGEYFIFENRAAVESDSAQMNPAYSRVKSPGLYVWHIDQSRINTGSFDNTINTGAVQGVALEQADGLNQLRQCAPNCNRGDLGDAFPGSTNKTSIDGSTVPGLRTNAGKVVAGRIDSIRIVGNTVLFRYRVENLLQITKFGTGTGNIQSSVPGNTADGVGVTPGTVVTLAPIPTPNHRFTGWGGDTTTTDSVLVITMDRNWTLTAQFSFVAAFTTQAAATDLLGGAALSAAQRALLDADGNDNGTYDLGDFLAWVTLSGQGVPPEVMARLMAAAGPNTGDAPKGVTP